MKHMILKTFSIIILALSLNGAVNAFEGSYSLFVVDLRQVPLQGAQTVPEPPMLLLLGAAFIGLVGRKYKR